MNMINTMKAKSVQFKAEQEQLRQELLSILNLQVCSFNESAKTITLREIDQDERKQAIMELLPKVRQYFTVTNKALIYRNDTKRPHLTIVRFLLKDSHQIVNKYVEEKGVKTIRYFFYHIQPPI